VPGNVVLVGFMGAGKSRVGRALADRLGRPFVDTDERLVARFGTSIGDYFRARGEAAFREAESDAVAQACRDRDQVVSLGGGAIARPDNLAAARDGNLLVYLKASPETIWRRLTASPGADERPMLAGDDPRARIAGLLSEREPLYAQADLTIETDVRTVEQIVDELARQAEAHMSLRVGNGLAGRIGPLLRELGLAGRAFVVSDDNVFPRHGAALVASLAEAGYRPAARAVPGAESSKSLATAIELYGWLAEERAERRDVVVAMGGGVVGDLGGFVAATYLRGLPVVQVPTTLLAQVDSAIGGKTAVNLEVGKNLVGAWHMPRLVLVDPTLLGTLPRRQVVSGWAETLKHALIMDGRLLERIESSVEPLLRLEPELTAEVVERSARLKVGVVAEDPREQGRRIILNYGHTIGHAVELSSDYGLHHGEAVAIGMTGAARIGQAVGLTPAALLARQTELLRRFGLPVGRAAVDLARVRAAMSVDKKVEGQTNRWVLLAGVGCPVVRRDVPVELVERVLVELGE
jgi:shikimate kinase / 3-dehydroquinate synthase